jgi:PAS domain S-box-containing protein
MTQAESLQDIRALEARVRELEGRLRESEAAASFLDSVLRAVPAFIVNVDPNLRIRYLNRYQVGYSADRTNGRHVLDYVAPEDQEPWLRELERARETGRTTQFITRAAGPHGGVATYFTCFAPLHEPDGSIGVCLAALDVTAEKATERALYESEEKLLLALDATGIGLWSWDLADHSVRWDENMSRLHGGIESQHADHYLDLCVHPDDRARVRRESRLARSSGPAASQVTHRIVWPDGSVRWILSVGRVQYGQDKKPDRVIGGSIDVTRRHELEDQLRQSQKMEAVGNLTAGIAHNFNNMLAVILPTLELAGELVPPARAELLRQASQAATRASELVRNLMTYAGHSRPPGRTPCGALDVIEAAVSMCRRTFEAHVAIAIEVEAGARSLQVEGSAVQLEQVLINLLLNARDAIVDAHQPRGLVTVRLRCAPVPLGLPEQEPRPALCIEVQDNGPGVPDCARARLFEPFFSTKPAGQGTGLGLATSFGTARDHGGTLTCSPASAGIVGAEFVLTLPISSARPREHDPLEAERPEEPPVRGSVLLVDDDLAVRCALGSVLASAGLTVLEAPCGHTALLALSESPVDVILLDRAMPGGAGEQFLPRLRELAPRARLVFLSGQPVEPCLAVLADAIVPKPVSSPDLLDTIRQVLEPRL